MRIAVFSDFDGTITLRDTNDALVDRYLGAERRQQYDALFLDRSMSLWRLIDTSLRACGIPLDTAIGHLLETVPLDPEFAGFLTWCGDREIPVEIVSAGVQEIIAAFLARARIDLPITANWAAIDEATFGLRPLDPDCHTGVDKAAVLLAARDLGIYTVFIGDGFSDRLAAPHADFVYAKGNLAGFCARKGIAHVPFERFGEVTADMATRFPR